MRDCNICFSAGTVNQYGHCEVCGEDHEEPARVLWGGQSEVVLGTRFRVIEGGADRQDETVLSADLDQVPAS